jgi:predicted cobalt transporter CbtA
VNEFQATAVFAALFALRCVAPLALTLLVGYLMNRLVDRWEREEAAEKAATPVAAPAPASAAAAAKPALPCWVFNNCTETKRAGCPAYKNQVIPCWLARMRSEGALPAGCPDCAIYRARLAPVPAHR